MRDNEKKGEEVKRLFDEQNGKCCYCGCQCKFYTPKQLDYNTYPNDLATLEHVYDKFDIRRCLNYGRYGIQGHKMSCYKCNHEKGNERNHIMQPIKEFFDIKQFLKCSKKKKRKNL